MENNGCMRGKCRGGCGGGGVSGGGRGGLWLQNGLKGWRGLRGVWAKGARGFDERSGVRVTWCWEMWCWAPPDLTCHLSEDKQRVTWPGMQWRDWLARLFSMQVPLCGGRSPRTDHVCSITMNYWSEEWSIWIGCILSHGQRERKGEEKRGSESCAFFLLLQGSLPQLLSLLTWNFFLNPEMAKIREREGGDWRGDNRCAPSFRELLVWWWQWSVSCSLRC